MPQYPRYAIYFVPPAHSMLYRFGASLLGYDALSGAPLPFADGIEVQIDGWKEMTIDPRKYGFHATLKAPMSLIDGRSETELMATVEKFARAHRAIPVIAPVVRAIGNFIAIVPDAPSPALQTLVDDCVTAFDSFRAPLTMEDRRRRNVLALTERQLAYLDRWGYPYVFEEYRFHMTFTGSIASERRASVLNVLQKHFGKLHLQHVAIDHVALLRQNDETSAFNVMSNLPLIA
jgi:putative phosphonate metabolism protein